MSDNTTILLNIINNIIVYKDLASILFGAIGTVLGVWAFVRTVRINRRLDDKPYFKNVFIEHVLGKLCKYVGVLAARDSVVRDRAQALEDIKNFLKTYNLKYDKRFKRVIQRIYGSGLKLQALKSCLNDLEFFVSQDFFILSKMGWLNQKQKSQLEKAVKRYLPKSPRPFIQELGENKKLEENKKYVKDVKKTNGNISMVTKRLAKQTAKFNRRIETYKLKFGVPVDNDS